MKKMFFTIIFSLFFSVSSTASNNIITEQNAADPSPDIKVERWTIFQLNAEGPSDGNPYVDVTISAEFSNGVDSYKVAGFYDGSGNYKIRFMSPTVGEWKYVTKSNRNELSGIEGTFNCVGAKEDNHGPVGVRNTHHFGYADGKPYWQIGTTCYAWVHQTEELQEQTLVTLKDSPFNKLRMCVFPKSYSYNNNEPPFYPFPRSDKGENDFTRFNPEFFEHFESRIIDLIDLGIEADIILFHPYDRWGYKSMDAETDDFYLKYVLARFSAFRNVWWSLANEYDLMESKEMSDWDRYYKIITQKDPYNHLAGIHNCFGFYNHSEPWVTHASIQSSALERAREWREQYKKPIVYDECRYEGNIVDGWGNQSAQEMVHKFWLGTVAGCYVGHGETFKHPDDIIWWSKGGVLYGESPDRIAFLKKIIETGPQDGIEPIDKYSGGKPGEYYLYYFGTETPKEWVLDLPESVKFEVELIDAWNMTISKLDRIYSAKFKIDLPGKEYQALRIKKVGYHFPIAPVRIFPEQGLFYKSVTVRLSTTDEAVIRYTLDGSKPTKTSTQYIEPIFLNETALLNARSFNNKDGKSKVASVQFTNAVLKTPVNIENLSSGLQYKYYEGEWNNLPEFDKLEEVESGIASEISLEKAKQVDRIGLVFEGFVKVEKDGVYTFYCSSDDGSRMWVADSFIIDNDGLHGTKEITGQIGLTRGAHSIKIVFFENVGGESLSASYEGPGIKKQIIPGNVMFHKN